MWHWKNIQYYNMTSHVHLHNRIDIFKRINVANVIFEERCWQIVSCSVGQQVNDFLKYYLTARNISIALIWRGVSGQGLPISLWRHWTGFAAKKQRLLSYTEIILSMTQDLRWKMVWVRRWDALIKKKSVKRYPLQYIRIPIMKTCITIFVIRIPKLGKVLILTKWVKWYVFGDFRVLPSFTPL